MATTGILVVHGSRSWFKAETDIYGRSLSRDIKRGAPKAWLANEKGIATEADALGRNSEKGVMDTTIVKPIVKYGDGIATDGRLELEKREMIGHGRAGNQPAFQS